MVADLLVAESITPAGWAIIIGSASAGIGSIVAAVFAGIASFRAKIVHEAVKTANGQTVGQLVDAAESRRIAEIPHSERTPNEIAHNETIPPESFERINPNG